MKTTQRGFIVPLLLIAIALLLGGGVYMYNQNKQVNPPVTENEKTIQATSTTMTIVGPDCVIFIKDATTFVFTDNKNKMWTVNHQNAGFSEISGTDGLVNHTDGLLATTLQDWLKGQKHVGESMSEYGDCAPGSITIIGVLNAEGIFVASSIEVNGQ